MIFINNPNQYQLRIPDRSCPILQTIPFSDTNLEKCEPFNAQGSQITLNTNSSINNFF